VPLSRCEAWPAYHVLYGVLDIFRRQTNTKIAHEWEASFVYDLYAYELQLIRILSKDRKKWRTDNSDINGPGTGLPTDTGSSKWAL
jgi:hypothetical protein